MGGFEILVMLIGVAVGAGAVYWWQEKRINRLEKDHKRALRKMAESAERNYAERNYNPPQVNTQANTQVNMQAVAPLGSQDLPPNVMQLTTSASRIPQGIATPPDVAVPDEELLPQEPDLSAAAILPTEPLADMSPLSDAIPEAPEELTLQIPELAAELTDLAELPDLSGVIPEAPEDLTLETLELTPELRALAALPDLSDPISDLMTETTEELPLTLIEQTAEMPELAELPDLSDTIAETPEELTLTFAEQPTELLLATAQLPELSEPTTEAQSLLTQIFEEPPFEINEPVVSMPISSPIAATPITTQSDKITTKIASWGQLTNPKYIPQLLEYAKHPDASVRMQVATGLGQIAAANAISAHTPQVIPVLERLSRDRHLETRYQAIVALGQIRSDQVIPILTSALRNSSTKLVKAASSALAKLNYPTPVEQTSLELPKKVVYKKPLH
jgi:HEAT repeats